MLIVALVIALAPLAWLVIKRMQHAEHADPAARGGRFRWVIVLLGAALAVRVGLAAPVLLRVALCLLAIGALVVWLRGRGQGGGGSGDDDRDSPVDPGPDPGSDHVVPDPERLDPEAFDRARAEWEHALKKHASD